jgi:hypothetical protein
VFDQTGDRLTPSHSKTAKGRRLRYYVSHRLVRGTAPRDPSGWRLPAPDLEDLVERLIGQHLMRPETRAQMVPDASVDEIARIGAQLEMICTRNDTETNAEALPLLEFAERIDIAPGEIRIRVSVDALTRLLELEPGRLADDHLVVASEFRHRKRGVETKLVLSDEATEMDETLFRNIARAHRYFDMIRTGQTFSEIARTENVSKRRVQQLIELAFLAPDVIRDVRDGRQPAGLTSDWLKRHAFPPLWKDQRELFSTL